MQVSPYIIQDDNLSNAWCTALRAAVDSPTMEITPLVVTLNGFKESENVRQALDEHLVRNRYATIHTVSETIFPKSLYPLASNDRGKFYNIYLDSLPRIKKIDSSNQNGTYFERLIAYDGRDGKINQLDIIISSLQSTTNKRRSKLQASIFDPTKDHTNRPYQSFPCLQHITFSQLSSGGLVINSFYAIQYLYRRAYGNWLGLINLGKFVAGELGVELERFNCFVGVEHLDKLGKRKAMGLLDEMSKLGDISK